jgi:predicted P-loop ATPase
MMANVGEFFSDSMTGKLDKDDLMILARNWINEWGELDGFTAKVYHGNIKHFLSKQEDTYRPPYGRDHQRVLRRSVIVGTTNRTDFLTDPTGDRRFWVIPVKRSIDLESLEKMVMGIWSAAILAYKMGESWRLPESLWQAQAENNREYYTVDPWLSVLEDKLRMESEMGIGITTLELLKFLIEKDVPHKYSKADEMRLADILRRDGWERKTIWRVGKAIKAWVKAKS